MRRFGAALIAALMAVGVFAPAAFAASPGTPSAKAVPRVVFIVGPAGAATAGYRAEARAAAAIARKYTPDVVELYSPDATWPAVKQALGGASLVVYMGHGNGWPSKYRDELYPPTQNGFGLNPTTGGDDSTHQYFGEASVGSQVKLAKNAVVLLNHLCYASGNSEPGLPEGTLDAAEQRVDNYAAGFIRAGASAVIAEAWSSPSFLVKAILAGKRSIQSAWQSSPNANDHRLAFKSQRSAGYLAQMDTETETSGFTRSIVMKSGLAPRDVRAGAVGSAGAAGVVARALPPEPTIIGSGLKLSAPDMHQLPAAGKAGRVDVGFKIKDRKSLPKGMQASVRWDPIGVAIVPADPATEVSPPVGAAPAPKTAPAASPATPPAIAPADVDTGASKTPPPATPSSKLAIRSGAGRAVLDLDAAPSGQLPDARPRVEPPAQGVDLVVPERLGDVVDPAAVKFGKTAMFVPVTMPSIPGRYRLTITLHDADGVAYDSATQALIPSLIVRVTGEFDGAIQAAPTAELVAGASLDLGVRVVNLGVTPWGHEAVWTGSDVMHVRATAEAAQVVGRWIPLTAAIALPADPAGQTVQTALPVALAPGVSVAATLALTAPTAPGEYLLLLDVVTPERGSLVATGADPTLVRVTVLPAP